MLDGQTDASHINKYICSESIQPPARLETTPEFEAAASIGHNPKGGDVSEGASATGPTFSWASTSSVLDRGREDKEAAELRLEDRMGAAVSKVCTSSTAPTLPFTRVRLLMWLTRVPKEAVLSRLGACCWHPCALALRYSDTCGRCPASSFSLGRGRHYSREGYTPYVATRSCIACLWNSPCYEDPRTSAKG